MTQDEIRAKSADIKQRLRGHDAARKIIEGERLALRHMCEHPKAKTHSYTDRSGVMCRDWECPDCGLQEKPTR